ncbi:splicing factor [Actinidia rufa]|uniref:Splicing factor n=1 Tax=Actinidia rufa TaxID=165716 RepID=A0A7J0EBA4_9ERIC|nr:splicing factor [Actinidia rufa]
MGPVMNSTDEYLRNNAIIAFSIVPSGLGIPQLLPFLKPVLEAVGNDVTDENEEVRIATALALAALAKASAPNGIESFESVFMPLLKGVIGSRHGKVLAAFLIVFGSLIPLMDAAYAIHFAREVMGVLVREFDLPDEQEKQIVLKTLKQCTSVEGVKADYNGYTINQFLGFNASPPTWVLGFFIAATGNTNFTSWSNFKAPVIFPGHKHDQNHLSPGHQNASETFPQTTGAFLTRGVSPVRKKSRSNLSEGGGDGPDIRSSHQHLFPIQQPQVVAVFVLKTAVSSFGGAWIFWTALKSLTAAHLSVSSSAIEMDHLLVC